MPTYEISTPDGKTFEIDAPDGASQAEVMAYAQVHAPKLLRQKAASAYAGGDDVSKMGAVMRGLGGAKHAWDRASLGLKDVFTDLSPEDRELLEQGKAFTEEAGTAGKVGEFAADMIPALAAGGAATSALRAGTAGLSRGAGALVRTLGELGTGAGLGAMQAMPDERGTGAAWGAGGSALGMTVNRVLGGLARPLVTDEARALMREGVQPTVGQSVGGALGKLEEKAMSVPFVGDSIRGARNRALNEFNERAIQQAAPGVRGVGDDAVQAAQQAISAQYQSALSRMPQNITVDAHPIIRAAVDAADDPALAMSEGTQRRFLDYVENNLLRRQANITPDIAKRIESDLGAATSRYINSANAEDRVFGEALRRLQGEWRNSLTAIGDSGGAQAGQALREADAAWRAFLPLDTAAASATSQSGETAGRFTPRALRRAIEKVDKTANNRATRFAQGGAQPFDRLNQLSRNADRVLPNTVPDSGTAGRLFGGGALGAAATMAATGQALPLALGAGAAAGGALGATRVGQQFLTQGLEPAAAALVRMGWAPEAAINVIREYGPATAMAMARAGAQQANN